MLKLKNIRKSYKTGEFVQHALKGVNLSFRDNEFVAILGPSGSGKTTMLNIIGGLDRYDEGDLIINNKSTKKFKDKDWDSYRNNCVGFIFQSYNLISHISILANVEMGMTLSGISKSARRKKAKEVLTKVGLKDHIHKRPNQLSGGQMQRVAIARALANDPTIILADEPTGALDSETSVQIMELIKEIAKDKLVIMVTHNPELAKEYANRIVEFKDGEKTTDSNPYEEKEQNSKLEIKKSKMSYLTALSLSFNNVLTKKGRTFLTALASSIGIIGIALILSLSNGFDIQIDEFEKNTLAGMPIMVSQQAMKVDPTEMQDFQAEKLKDEQFPSDNIITPEPSIQDQLTHKNVFTDEYLDLLDNLDPEKVSGVSYTRIANMNLLTMNNDKVTNVTDKNYFGVLPTSLGDNENEVLDQNFDLLAGNLPTNKYEVIIAVDSYNYLSEEILKLFGIPTDTDFNVDELIGKELKMVSNDNFYNNLGPIFIANENLDELYESEESITITITGIVRGKEGNMLYEQSMGILYTDELVQTAVEMNKDSEIVKAQLNADYNVLSGQVFKTDETGIEEKENMLAYLGYNTYPVMIQIFPKDFESKDYLLAELDKYNENKLEEEQIIYTDMAALITSLSGSIMDAITIVLVAFSAISLIVSSIMIGIITYISVLERTKEIGVLRSLGARKKDITRVFNSETFIIGLFSGILGISIALILTIPANIIIYNLTDLKNVAVLNPVHAIMLIMISLVLTVLGGFIPAKIASKKDPVIALRTE